MYTELYIYVYTQKDYLFRYTYGAVSVFMFFLRKLKWIIHFHFPKVLIMFTQTAPTFNEPKIAIQEKNKTV